MKLTLSLLFGSVLMFFVLFGLATPTVIAAEGCVIPESGPWPPCATGGNAADSNSDCVIPERGPWPPCATGGGGSANSGGCVIPERGPWPPCATGGDRGEETAQPVGSGASQSNSAWVVHQGRGTKQTPILLQGPQDGRRIASVEVEIDFTYSASACAVTAQTVDKGVLGYALVSPSGTKIELFAVGDLSGMQSGARAKMRFADGGNRLNHIASGRYQSADSLSQLNGENPYGEWTVVITKQSFNYAVCQHSATLHITTTQQQQ